MFKYESEPERGSFHEVAPGIRRMVAANSSPTTYHGTNTYLIEAQEGRYVIDPGPAADHRHLNAIMSALDGEGAGILLTHHHLDHSGAVERLRQLSGLSVYARDTLGTVSAKPDVVLSDGDKIADLSVLHTPGHASDHLCFRRDDGTVFTGDHIMTWNSTVIVLPDGDMSDYFAQLRRFTEAQSALYLPGHGPPMRDPVAYTRWLLDRRVHRENSILRRIGKVPATVADLVRWLYGKPRNTLAWAAERNVESHLAKLLTEGRVVSDGASYKGV